MSDERSRRLTAGDKEALLARLARKSAPGPVRERPIPIPPGATDFTTLPGYRELQTQRSFAEMIGLGNPFFRVHEERAGAETLIGNRTYLNFGSYDYLGLNGHPEVQDAAKAAIDRYGTSTSASRLVAGERPIHRELEAALAELYGAEDCVAMVSGHATNVGTIGAIVGPRDLVVYDQLAHNSIYLGAQLSGATRRAFPHNDLDELVRLLTGLRGSHTRCLIIVEGLYSMDGDAPDLARLIEIKQRFGAWLMVDDAHGLGVLGTTGRGLAEHARLDPRLVDIWMGTLSKTLAGAGGYIAGPRPLTDFIRTSVGAFVFSVGLSPPVAAASHTALRIMLREPDRVRRLHENGAAFLSACRAHGLDAGDSMGLAITPVILGESLKAATLADRLAKRGINAMPILHPAVEERLARLRFFITSEHTLEQVREAAAITAEETAGLPSTAETVQAMARSLS
ncbi:aminotransferase class I/II-fold pyridoxal phosphate-dependent enzyme [Enterovirga rhinocerotis]|uniref:8-amino-7-oxononanoate synthase n=1 Tax=Enterovirga rhinocerotis TaxID=1339210 RepID=A0A4R7C5S2_9HYPH|nr:aminotransferase class I/II-fold pyridoxal phosphate-dependent enzyme [Enterovirga rhinocerotis]TDR93910.1 8-amino-7-oxononanoate synthase [Enterovirga rhinocerotis]